MDIYIYMLRGFLVFWFFGLQTRMNKGFAKSHTFLVFWLLFFWLAFPNYHTNAKYTPYDGYMSIFQAIGITAIKKTVHVNPACFKHTPENLARMGKGKSPIGIDGLSVNLHHIGRKHNSPLATVTDTFQCVHSKALHSLPPQRKKSQTEKI